MELSVEVENTSPILRKMKIKVPAKVVRSYFEKRLVDVQKTANLKGFRPGHAPLSMIKQFYGDDIRHRVLHSLIDESFEEAVKEKELKAVGSPKIDTPEHKTGEGAHDHTLNEESDLKYEATFEVMPEVKVKGYTGISVNQDKVEITDENVEKVVENLLQSQAQLVPVGGGVTLADGTQSSRPIQKGDFADTQMAGGLVTESGVVQREDMKGSKLIEVGSNVWIPGFEDNLIGMRQGETKTFRLKFPSDYGAKELANQEAEFTVTINEVKEKKLPTLDDEFVKQMGYENLEDLRAKAKDYLAKEKTEESDRKLRSDLLAKIIEKNPFDVPAALVESQTRALAQDWAQELKRQGFNDAMVQEAIMQEIQNLRKRAESQVRASLILESIAKDEEISVQPQDLEAEMDRLAVSMNVDRSKLNEFYAKNPGRKDDLEFRLRQDRTIKFLLDKAKIKSVSPSEK